MKVGRWGKKKREREREIKSLQGGGAPRGAELRPCGECTQDGRAQAGRSRSCTNLPRQKGVPRELGQDPRRAGMPSGSQGH